MIETKFSGKCSVSDCPIGVLLNGAGFTQVRVLWTFILPFFDFAAELKTGQNGDGVVLFTEETVAVFDWNNEFVDAIKEVLR